LRRFLIIGILGLVVIAGAIGLNFWFNGETTNVANAPVSEPSASVPPNASSRGSGIPVPSPPPVAAYRSGPSPLDASSKNTETQGISETIKPAFDVVRINPEGDAVIAGRAAPGADVRIYDGGKLIGTVTADSRGEWVYLPTTPLPEGQRELSLTATNLDKTVVESEAVVVLAVPSRAAPQQVADMKAGGTVAKRKIETGDSQRVKGSLAVLVQRDGSKPSRVLQKPTEAGGVRKGNLSVDIVDYDEAGNISIGGKGKPGTDVQVYLNNKLVGGAITSPEGEWQITPDDQVLPGIYKLRVDAISGGQVVARVELPFSRAQQVANIEGESLVIVQPGNSLWRIARRTMGSGMKYAMIYDANRAQILDPDMIFPGQVFALPQTN
jgi:nucleoid-associated protein YgaU